MVVTDARCKQMIQKVKESGVTFIDRTSIGAFLRLLFNDILKEESDVAAGNNIELSKISGMISTYGKQWFFKNESTFDTL